MCKKILFIFFCFPLFIISCNSVKSTDLCREYIKIGDSYAELKKYKEAETYFQKARADKSLEKICVYKLGKLYQKTKNWKSSAECFFSLIQDDSENITLKENLAFDYGMDGKLQEAISIYSEIEESGKLTQKNLENFITILIAANENEKARQKIDELSEKFPDSSKLSVFKQKIEVTEEN